MDTLQRNFLVKKGASFKRTLTVYQTVNGVKTPANLTGFNCRGSIKKYASDSAVVADFVVTFSTDRSDGQITIYLSPATTGAIPTEGVDFSKKSRYTYDLFLEDTLGEEDRIMEGFVDVSPRVTV